MSDVVSPFGSGRRQTRRRPDTVFDWPRFALLVPLVGLSWWSTTNGLLGIIEVGSGPPTFFVTASISIAILVLTALMSWTVGALGREETGRLKPAFGLGYALLACLSVGFGFGFYWTLIEARGSAERTALASLSAASDDLMSAEIAVGDALSAMSSVVTLSDRRATEEAEIGDTCGGAAGPGAGPRFRLRSRDAAELRALGERLSAAAFGAEGGASPQTWNQRRDDLSAAIDGVRGGALASATPASARVQLAELNAELRSVAHAYEAFRTGPVVGAAMATMRQRARQGETGFAEGSVEFLCADPELETSLRLAASALEALPDLGAASFDAPLGAEATVAAFQRLTRTVLTGGGILGRGDRPAGMLINSRDMIPLLIAVCVDLFIFLLSFTPLRRPAGHRRGQRSPRLAIAYALLDREARADEGRTVTIVMEQLFWHRGAYHLALPLASPGEAPLLREEYNLSIAAAILADTGYLEPVRLRLPQTAIKGWMALRYGRARSRPIRQFHDVYRIERGALPMLIAEISACDRAEADPNALVPNNTPSEDASPARTDWRFALPRRASPSTADSTTDSMSEPANEPVGSVIEASADASATVPEATNHSPRKPDVDIPADAGNPVLRWVSALTR